MAEPFIKWPGGKRRFASSVMGELLPDDFASRVYVEPMVGGGACFYAHGSSAPSCILGDVNERLIQTYMGVRDDPEAVIDSMIGMEVSESAYYDFRAEFNERPSDPIRVAALFMYINACCFNGVYRENAKGEFNVPWGEGIRGQKIASSHILGRIRDASKVLQGVELRCSPLSKLLSWCPEGAFVFFDPPYVTKGEFEEGGGFTTYSSGGFTETDLRLLSGVSRLLAAKRNCKVMITHSDVAVARDVFAWMNKHPVLSSYVVSRSGDSRGDVAELVFTSY